MTTVTTANPRAPDAVATATVRLAAAGVASPRTDAELLAAHVLGVPRARLALAGELTPSQAREYAAAVGRRTAGVPVQHVTGVAYFRHLELAVGPGVFVPRPETEVLVEHVLGALRSGPVRPVVVDLCAGSGAIALAVAAEHPAAVVHAVEREPDAYEWARRNAAGTPVRLHLAEARDCLSELTGDVDVVTANPPYVPAGAALPPEVRHDPPPALFAGPDGLDGIWTVAAAAARLLRPGGLLACEHGEGHADAVRDVLAAVPGWAAVAVHHDLTGRSRFTTATRTDHTEGHP